MFTKCPHNNLNGYWKVLFLFTTKSRGFSQGIPQFRRHIHQGGGVAAVVTQVELSAVSRKRRGQILFLCKFYLFGDII
jgi:hypothetical protein